MMKTERMVNAMPFSAMLSRSSCAIMSYRKATLRSASAMMGNATVVFCVSLMSLTHWSCELRSLALWRLCQFRVVGSDLSWVTYKAQHLHATGVEFVLQLCEGAELGGADGREVGGVREQDRP